MMPASEAQIAEVERHFGMQLPDDYRRFLLTRGAVKEFFPPAKAFVEIYPVEEIIPVNEAGFIGERFPGAMVIGGDGSRVMLIYDFRRDPPPLVLLDITAEGWSDAIHQATSLTTLLKQLSDRGWLFK
jgi:hypothetical protein